MNRFNAQLDVPYILHTADYAEKDGIVFIPVYWAWLLQQKTCYCCSLNSALIMMLKTVARCCSSVTIGVISFKLSENMIKCTHYSFRDECGFDRITRDTFFHCVG